MFISIIILHSKKGSLAKYKHLNKELRGFETFPSSKNSCKHLIKEEEDLMIIVI